MHAAYEIFSIVFPFSMIMETKYLLASNNICDLMVPTCCDPRQNNSLNLK
jgi:hypothetical protein